MTTTIDSVRDEFTAWLRDSLPAEWVKGIDSGDDDLLQAGKAAVSQRDLLAKLAAAGWAQPTWDPGTGGRGLDADQAAVVESVKDDYQLPRSFSFMGLGLAAPTIRQWGSDDVKRKFLSGIAAGEQWCQLFSEPGNGSDVAGLATRAERDGDEWIINGQKVWTSGAQNAQWGMLIARTHPDQPKHKGITYFACDMHAPGVEVRPLRQMTGNAEFNEVFLTDVRIPDAWRVGPEGEGWSVAQTTLMNERVALSGGFGGAGRPGAGGRAAVTRTATQQAQAARARGRVGADDLVRRAKELGAWDDRTWRDRITQLWIEGRVAGLNNQRAAAQRRVGQPGPEGSVGKLFQAEYNQRLTVASIDLMGAAGAAWPPDDQGTQGRVYGFLRARGNTIEGGTSEIQRNILGDRVLGLPREPDVSKDLPWKDVPRS
jgi:alkylation response protein AidB-like acyl-CoA dehydrogenase